MTLRRAIRRSAAWLRSLPAAIAAGLVALVVLSAGTAIIVQSESSYQQEKQEETRVQGEILAASIVAALDFGDSVAAQEAAEAMRVNRQIRGVGIYDHNGNRIAGYRRDGRVPKPTLAESRATGSPGNRRGGSHRKRRQADRDGASGDRPPAA